MAKRWLCLLVLLLLSSGATAERTLKVGVLFSHSGPASTYGQGRNITARWTIDQEDARTDGCLRRHGIRLEAHIHNVRSNVDLVKEVTRELVHDVGVSFLVGAESVLGGMSAPIAAERGVPVCLPLDGNDGTYINPDGTRKHRNVFGTMVLASNYFAGFYRLAAANGARRLAIVDVTGIGSTTPHYMGLGSASVAAGYGLEVVYAKRVAYTSATVEQGIAINPTVEDEIAVVGAIFGELIAAKPDVLALATVHGCDTFVNLTREWNWRPQGAVVFECLNRVHLLDPGIVDYLRGVFVPSQWHSDLTGPGFTDDPGRNFASAFPFSPDRGVNATAVPSAAQMRSIMQAVFRSATPPAEWGPLVAMDISCYYALFSAACLTNSTAPELLHLGVHGTNLFTFAGPLTFSRLGVNLMREMPILQLKWHPDAGAPGELAPAADGAYVPFWGLPTFEELKGEARYRWRTSEVIALIFTGVEAAAILVLMGLLVLLGWVRRSSTIRAMAVPLSLAHLAGLLLLLGTVALFRYSATLAVCRARWILLTLGVSLATTPLTLKLYRVDCIYKANTLLAPIISNRSLAAVLAGICTTVVLGGVLLTCLDGQTALEQYMPLLRDRNSWYYECSYSAGVEVVAGALCFTQTAVAIAMAVRARDVPHTFSAAFGTILAVYTDLILVLLFAVIPGLVEGHDTATTLRLSLILLFPLANVIAIYAYPVISALRGIEVDRFADDANGQQTVIGESDSSPTGAGSPAGGGGGGGGRGSSSGHSHKYRGGPVDNSRQQRLARPRQQPQPQPQRPQTEMQVTTAAWP